MFGAIKTMWAWDESEPAGGQTVPSTEGVKVDVPQPEHSTSQTDGVKVPKGGEVTTQQPSSQVDAVVTGEAGDDGVDLDRQMEEDLKKVVDTAKEWGSYFFTMGKKATNIAVKHIDNATKLVKEQIEESADISFAGRLRSVSRSSSTSDDLHDNSKSFTDLPPWTLSLTAEGETPSNALVTSVKMAVLALSGDEANFLAPLTSSVEGFEFDSSSYYPMARAALKHDPKLQDLRFALVPRRVKEDQFWCHYFQRVWRIKCEALAGTLIDSDIAERLGGSTESTQSADGGEASSSKEDASPSTTVTNSVVQSDELSLDDFEMVTKEDIPPDIST